LFDFGVIVFPADNERTMTKNAGHHGAGEKKESWKTIQEKSGLGKNETRLPLALTAKKKKCWGGGWSSGQQRPLGILPGTVGGVPRFSERINLKLKRETNDQRPLGLQ